MSTAVRAFALAMALGTALGDGTAQESAPLTAALLLVAGVSSVLEWDARKQSRPWIPVGEAMLVAVLLAGAPGQASLLVYLGVPPIVAGVRHGWVTTFNTAIVAAISTVLTLAVVPDVAVAGDRAVEAAPWLVIGAGVGLLAAWQSRSMRDIEARQAPYAAANQLLSQLHALASRGSVGLDSVQLGQELESALRAATGAERSAVFIHGRSSESELLSSHAGDTASPPPYPAGEDTDTRVARLWLHGGQERTGSVVLVREAGWTEDLLAEAQAVANDFVLRLDTAVLFDDVRLMATAEERNRIAREMHDGVAQEIVALGYIVDEIESLPDQAQDHAQSQAQTNELAAMLRREISRIVTELRLSIFDLRHEVADHHLSGALAEYVRELSHCSDLRVHLLLDESGPALPARTEMELLRVAQEAISNVRKHADADNLWVTLATDGFNVRLEVEDDGAGNAAPRDHHWGLQTMKERATSIGASLTVRPRPAGGTVVCLQTCHNSPREGNSSHEHHSPAR